jgi:hypothetical protein
MNDLSAPTTKQLSSDEASALDGVATAPNPKPLKRLVASHLQKSYGGRQVVKDVSLAINEGKH